MSYTVDDVLHRMDAADALMKADCTSVEKFLFISPRAYRQLVAAKEQAQKRVLDAKSPDPVTIHIACKDLDFAINAVNSDIKQVVRGELVVNCAEKHLVQLFHIVPITDAMRQRAFAVLQEDAERFGQPFNAGSAEKLEDKAVISAIARHVLRSIRDEMVAQPHIYKASGGTLALPSQLLLYEKLEKEYAVAVPDLEKRRTQNYVLMRAGRQGY